MQLPEPSADALAHSAELLARIRSEVRTEGWVSFARYMERALYEPGLGYYSGGSRKFGEEGDFITAPGLTPLFGQTLARQVADIMALSAPHVLEVGAGTGMLAADVLGELERLGQLPTHYDILELSGELRARQQATLQEQVPHLADRVRWLDTLPETFDGVVLANEVLDVMPAHLVVAKADGLYERGVALANDDSLTWADRPLAGRLAAAAAALDLPQPGEGEYLTEISLAARAWIAEWATRLRQGALLLIDYGYPAAEFYLPSRSRGTLLCYYRHRAHDDPFRWPGLTDITVFVDFSALADAAYDNGLDVLGYTTQAGFLFDCGILERLAQRGDTTSVDYIRAARAVHRLTTAQEMGELFKVLAVGRDVAEPLRGFLRHDRRAAL